MSQAREIKIGQKIFLKPINNAARRGVNVEIREAEVAKVGRKYFELKEGYYGKFHIENLTQVSDYTPSYQGYFSKQDIEEEIESKILYDEIRHKYFNYYQPKISLKILREIESLLNSDQNPERSVATEDAQ